MGSHTVQPTVSIPPPQAHRQTLEQVASGLCWRDARALSKQPTNGEGSLLTPAPQHLHHQRDKRDPGGPTVGLVAMGSQLSLLPNPQGMTWSNSSTGNGEVLQGGYHRHIQGSRATPIPVREKNINRSASRAWNQSRDFLPRSKGSRLGSSKDSISERVMAMNAATIPTTRW